MLRGGQPKLDPPDLRPALARYGPEDIADLFDAFTVTVTYNKPTHTLELAATVTTELVPAKEDCNRLVGGRRIVT